MWHNSHTKHYFDWMPLRRYCILNNIPYSLIVTKLNKWIDSIETIIKKALFFREKKWINLMWYYEMYEEPRCSYSAFYDRYTNRGIPIEEAILPTKAWYNAKRYNWKTIEEIMKITGRSYHSVRNSIYKHKGITLDEIKNVNKRNNAVKYSLNWKSLKSICKERCISYSIALYRIRNGMNIKETLDSFNH